MNRETTEKEVLEIKNNNILLEFPTGFGKTKIAIGRAKALKCKDILIVVYRNVHKSTWAKEIQTWWKGCDARITMTTYSSLHKYGGKYDMCIFDECHHLSERCRELVKSIDARYVTLLSATVTFKLKNEFCLLFPQLYISRISLRQAIDDHVLPDPRVFLIPMEISNTEEMRFLWKNKSGKGQTRYVKWQDRWDYANDTIHPIVVTCTNKQYLGYLNSQIDYWRSRYMRSSSEPLKNKWLRLCNVRLRWLSDLKTPYVKKLLGFLDDKRTITFCSSVSQTVKLGKYCINSKNTSSPDILQNFNMGQINHITACNILNEGVNITNCQIGIYANLNNSDIIVRQRTGRLLRHPKPVIVIPYFKETRDEELVRKMLENYNKDLVTVINDFHDIKI